MSNKTAMINLLNNARIEILDLLTIRIGYLYVTELVSRTGTPIFHHDGIKMQVNAEVISCGLKKHIKEYFIDEFGLEDGIYRAYQTFKGMYAENTGEVGLPDSLTDDGRELVSIMLADAVDSFIAYENETFH